MIASGECSSSFSDIVPPVQRFPDRFVIRRVAHERKHHRFRKMRERVHHDVDGKRIRANGIAPVIGIWGKLPVKSTC